MATIPVATISFSDRLIAQVNDDDLPYDCATDLYWHDSDGERFLSVVDKYGVRTRYDFGIIQTAEARCAALSIRISEQGAFQADCLLGKTDIPAPMDFLAGLVNGLRLQPILLPGLSAQQRREVWVCLPEDFTILESLPDQTCHYFVSAMSVEVPFDYNLSTRDSRYRSTTIAAEFCILWSLTTLTSREHLLAQSAYEATSQR